jgi:hypothetical protein
MCSDVLNPVYVVNGMLIEDDKKSRPKAPPRQHTDPFFSLTTADIEGATPGWKPKCEGGAIADDSRRHYRNTNFVGDIKVCSVAYYTYLWGGRYYSHPSSNRLPLVSLHTSGNAARENFALR